MPCVCGHSGSDKPEQLAYVHINSPHCCRGDFYSNHADLTGETRLQQQQQGFSGIAAWCPTRHNLSQGGEVALAASLLPAQRAATVDPMESLREE